MIQDSRSGLAGKPIHAQVLAAAQRLCSPLDWTFRLVEVVGALPHLNESSIRTHVVSRCCVNAPQNHVHRWPYFRRVGRGVYKILPEFRRTAPAGAPVREGVGIAGTAVETMPGNNEAHSPLRTVIHASVVESEGWYVAECLEAAVATQGRTLDEVLANLRAALELHLDRQELVRLGLAQAPRLVVSYETPAFMP